MEFDKLKTSALFMRGIENKRIPYRTVKAVRKFPAAFLNFLLFHHKEKDLFIQINQNILIYCFTKSGLFYKLNMRDGKFEKWREKT